MYKIINDCDLPFDHPVLSLIDIHSKGVDKSYMTKKAYMMTETISKIRPEPGWSFLHMIAMGAGEYYGSNRNGDWFNEKSQLHTAPEPGPDCPREVELGGGLKEYYSTFKTNANVYREHANKDPSKRRGTVSDAAYNDIMHRVELVIKVDNNICSKEINKISNGEQIFFSMACFLDPEYPILTKDGYKPISSIIVGDLVLTHKGNWKKVKSLNRRKYTGKACTMHVNGLPFPMALTAEHPLWAKIFSGSRDKATLIAKAKRYFKNPKDFDDTPDGWVCVDHIQEGDRVFYQPVTRYTEYGNIGDEDLARLMGYYLAEGSISYQKDGTPCTVQLTCNMNDSLLRDVPKLVEKNLPGTTCSIVPHRSSKTCFNVLIHNTYFAQFIHNFLGIHSKNKYICPEIFNSDESVKLAFLGAWVDGDGFTDNKGVHWSTANKNMVLQGRDLLATIGIPASIYKIDHAKYATSGYENSGIEYTLNIATLDAARLSPWSDKVAKALALIPETQRTRPAALRPTTDGRYAYRVKKVERYDVVDADVYNFEVEDDESYSAAGIISHNCTVPHDTCAICHNQAKTPSEYCHHITTMNSRILKSGHKVVMINDKPNFFDISFVLVPADRIAGTLRKIASAPGQANTISAPFEVFLRSPDHAVATKAATLAKLADIEKEIEGNISGVIGQQSAENCLPPKNLPENFMNDLCQHDSKDAISSLNNCRVLLSLPDYLKLVMGSKFSEIQDDVPYALNSLPTIFNDLKGSNDLDEVLGHDEYSGMLDNHRGGMSVPNDIISKYSLDSKPVMNRSIRIVITGGNVKNASKNSHGLISKRGAYLAREYAKYAIAFASGGSSLDRKLLVMSNRI